MLENRQLKTITMYLKPGVECSLYVNNFQICLKLSTMSIIECQLQLYLKKLQQWETDNGFRFKDKKEI